jgi:hypothetical protein
VFFYRFELSGTLGRKKQGSGDFLLSSGTSYPTGSSKTATEIGMRKWSVHTDIFSLEEAHYEVFITRKDHHHGVGGSYGRRIACLHIAPRRTPHWVFDPGHDRQ